MTPAPMTENPSQSIAILSVCNSEEDRFRADDDLVVTSGQRRVDEDDDWRRGDIEVSTTMPTRIDGKSISGGSPPQSHSEGITNAAILPVYPNDRQSGNDDHENENDDDDDDDFDGPKHDENENKTQPRMITLTTSSNNAIKINNYQNSSTSTIAAFAELMRDKDGGDDDDDDDVDDDEGQTKKPVKTPRGQPSSRFERDFDEAFSRMWKSPDDGWFYLFYFPTDEHRRDGVAPQSFHRIARLHTIYPAEAIF